MNEFISQTQKSFKSDIDVNLAITILLDLFKNRVSDLVFSHSIVMPDGKIMVKGDAVHKLLTDLVEYQKQIRLDSAFYDVERSSNHELIKELAVNEAMAREKDARDRERELKQQYPYKYSDEGE